MANTLGGTYQTGTVTISVDRLTVVGVGTFWASVLSAGDWILIGGQVGLVQAVNSNTNLTLQSQWQGTLPSAASYVAIKMSWLRYDPALTQAKLRELLAQLAEQGNFIFTSVAPPDMSVGQDGQWALKTDVSPWRLWFKTGGVWVEQAAPAGMNWRGVWSAAIAYGPGDGVSRSGSSYIGKTSNTNKPPEANPADWDLMAAQGSTGNTGATGPQGLVWRGTWSAATAYIVNDAVALGGASYIAIAPNTNQTPPNATYWGLLAQGGSSIIAPDSVTPPMLDAGTALKQQQFRDRIVAAPVNAPALTGNGSIAGNWGVGGALNVTGVGSFSGGAGIGSGVATGLFSDGANVAIRTLAGGAKIYFQNASGIATFGDWDSTRLNVVNALVVGGATTHSGDITITKATPSIFLNKNLGTEQNLIWGTKSSLARWVLILGSGIAESGANAGSDFSLLRYDDAGGFIGAALNISRAAGIVSIPGVAVSSGPTTGALIVAGGVGIGGALNVGGDNGINIQNSLGVNTRGLARFTLPSGTGVVGSFQGLCGTTFVAGIDFGTDGAANSGRISFATSNAGSILERAYIAKDGTFAVAGTLNVGGAATDPLYAFHVNGRIKSSGSVALLGLTSRSGTITTYGIYDPDGLGLQFDVGSGSAFTLSSSASGLGRALINYSTPTSNPSSGALVVVGGAGIGLGLNVGQDISCGNLFVGRPTDNVTISLNSSAGTTPTMLWRIAGTTQFTHFVYPVDASYRIYDADSSHGVYLTQNSNSWTSISDRRLRRKQNARTVTGLLARLDRFRLIEYGEDHRELSVIAQEFHEFIPHLVDVGDAGDRIIDNLKDNAGLWGVRPAESGFAALQVCKEIWASVDHRLGEIERRLAA